MSLEEVLGAIERDIREGMARSMRMHVTSQFGDFLAPVYLAYSHESSQAEVVAFTQATDALATLIAEREGVVSATPMADLWMHAIEVHNGPVEISTSVVKRGDVDVFFDGSYGNVAARFAREATRDRWFMEPTTDPAIGSPIAWEALEDAGDVDDEDGYDAAIDEWNDILASGYTQDPDIGTVGRLYETEQGDVLYIPDGMVNVSDEAEGEVEDSDAYWSWPKDAIPAKYDPRRFGFELARLSIAPTAPMIWGKARALIEGTTLEAPTGFRIWVRTTAPWNGTGKLGSDGELCWEPAA